MHHGGTETTEEIELRDLRASVVQLLSSESRRD